MKKVKFFLLLLAINFVLFSCSEFVSYSSYSSKESSEEISSYSSVSTNLSSNGESSEGVSSIKSSSSLSSVKSSSISSSVSISSVVSSITSSSEISSENSSSVSISVSSSSIISSVIYSSEDSSISLSSEDSVSSEDEESSSISSMEDSSESSSSFQFFGEIIYVSPDGESRYNGGLGTIDNPLNDIQDAIDLAIQYNLVKIYVMEGTYSDGNGIRSSEEEYQGIWIKSHNLQLIGGWNDTFTVQSGKSILDATGCYAPYTVIYAYNVTNVIIDGFIIKGGNNDGNEFPNNVGGGICLQECSGFKIQNTIVMSNNARFGGGIYIYSGNNNTINADVINNTAEEKGGGIFIESSPNNVINANINDNVALEDYGGIFIYSSLNTVFSGGTISGNVANTNVNIDSGIGGGIGFYDCSGTIINNTVTILNNISRWGAGIYFYGGNNNHVRGNIIDNNATSWGGGILSEFSMNNIIQCVISNNIAASWGGGIATYFCTNSLIQSVIRGNQIIGTTGIGGGGVYLCGGDGNIIQGSILLDNISSTGAGIVLEDAENTSILDSVINFTESPFTEIESVIELKDFNGGLSGTVGPMLSNLTIGGGPDGGTYFPTFLISETGTGGDITPKCINDCVLDNKSGSKLYNDKVNGEINNTADLDKTGANEVNGNTATTNINPNDDIPPTVVVNTPTQNQVFIDQSNITVSGTASDTGGSGLKRVDIAIDNGSYSPANGTDNWSKSITLGVGLHVISVIAVDNAGNSSSIIERTIRISNTIQMERPKTTLTINTNVFEVESGKTTNVTISGIASCAPTHQLSLVRMEVDNSGSFSGVKTLSGTNIEWNITLTFGVGSHTIRVFVEDNYAGNVSDTNTITFNVVVKQISGVAFTAQYADNQIWLDGNDLYYPSSTGKLIKVDISSPNFMYTYWTGMRLDSYACAVDNLYVYLSDTYNRRVLEFNKLNSTIKYYDATNIYSKVRNVSSIAVNSGYIFVADNNSSSGNVILVYAKNDYSKVVGWIGKAYGEPGIWHKSSVSYSSGNGNGELSKIGGIYATETELYVVDNGNYRVQVYTLTLPASVSYNRQWGSYGTNENKFYNPTGLWVQGSYVFICDDYYDHPSIKVWTTAGTFIKSIGGIRGTRGLNEVLTNFAALPSITADMNNVYINDRGNSRIVRLPITMFQ